MVKRRGYRVELGEIEAGLYRHPAVEEAAVVACADEAAGVRIGAFVSCRDDEAAVTDRDEALLRGKPAALHDSRPILVGRRVAENVDGQGRLPAAEGTCLNGLRVFRGTTRCCATTSSASRRPCSTTMSWRAIATRSFPARCGRSAAKSASRGLPVPEEFGGSGVDALTCAIALEALGYGCHDGGLVFALAAHLLVMRGADVEIRQRRAEASLPAGAVRRNADRRARDDRAGIGLGRVRAAHACSCRWRRSTGSTARRPSSRTAGRRRRHRLCGDRSAKGFHGGITACLVEEGHAGSFGRSRFEKIGLRTSPSASWSSTTSTCRLRRSSPASARARRSSTTAMEWERICSSPPISARWNAARARRSRMRAHERNSANQSASSRRSVDPSPT